MFDKVLIATDGSLGSKSAFAQAIEIARASNCELTILNVTLTPEAFWGYNPYGSKVTDEDLTQLGQKIIDETIAGINIDGIKLTRKVRLGSPELEILDEACTQKVDLIILGSRGIGLLTGTFLGSVSDRLLKIAPFPVLIVKDPDAIAELECMDRTNSK